MRFHGNIRFTEHALLKFEVLRQQGVEIDRDTVVNVILYPQEVAPGHDNRLIAQAQLDAERVLRVVYEESDDEIVIVTFYPGRRSRYERNGVQQRR